MNSSQRVSDYSRHDVHDSPVILQSFPSLGSDSRNATTSPLTDPQSRREPFNLKDRNRLRRRRLNVRPSKSLIPFHVPLVYLFRATTNVVVHPVRSTRIVGSVIKSAIRNVDNAFKHPGTGQRMWRQAWLRAYVPLFIWLGVSLTSTFVVLFWHSQVFETLDSLSTHLQARGNIGRLILGSLIFITTFPPLPLYSTLIVLCGFSFGIVEGFIISYVAALLGAIVVFVLSRSLLRSWMLGLLDQSQSLKKVVRAIEKRPKLLFLIRLAPYPYNLMNTLLASSSTLNLKTYTICTALALPKLFIHCGVGTTIKNFAVYNGAGARTKEGAVIVISDGIPAKSSVLIGGVAAVEEEATASGTAELIKNVAGFFGIGLCVGIFVYLFRVASRAVDEELDEGDGHEFKMSEGEEASDVEDDDLSIEDEKKESRKNGGAADDSGTRGSEDAKFSIPTEES